MDAPSPEITREERGRLVSLLRESRDALMATVEPLSDAQWRFTPGAARWSIGEIVEHLGLVEASLFGRVEAALARPARQDWQLVTGNKDEVLERWLLDRSQTRDAPDRVRPTGAIARREAVQRYREARHRTLEFATLARGPLKAHTEDHNRPAYGTLSAYQWLLFIALHNLRHNQQVAEVLGAPGFPSD